MKRILLVMTAITVNLVAQQRGDAQFVVHSKADVFFNSPTSLLKRVNLTVQRNALVAGDDFNPRLATASTYDVATGNATGTLATPSTAPLAGNIVDSTQYNDVISQLDVLKGDITGLRTTTTILSNNINSIFRGEFNLPVTQMAPQDVARVASIESRIKELDQWRAGASIIVESVNDLPIVSTISDVASLSALSPFITPIDEGHKGFGAGVSAVFTRSMTLPHTTQIVIDADLTLNGHGEWLAFAGGQGTQLIINNGATLTLENITLKNIHAHTIEIKPGGTVVCGKSVVWELNDDIAIDTGTLVLGTLQMEQAEKSTTMQMRGVGGIRRCTIGSNAQVRLKSHTLGLHAISLHGAEQVFAQDRVLNLQAAQYGAIAVCGNAAVVTNDVLRVGLVASGTGNMLMCDDNAFLGGPILFADDGHNQLHLVIRESGDGVAHCQLAGQALFVASARGTAHLYLHNRLVEVRSLAPASCVIGAHGKIHAQTVALTDHPVVALSAAGVEQQALFSAQTEILTNLSNPISTALRDPFIFAKSVAAPLKDTDVNTLRFEDTVVHAHHAVIGAMQGTAIVDGGTITDWSVDTENTLHLTLRNGAHIVQKNQTALKYDDKILVEGKNNHITITGVVDWQGGLDCRPDSELTITCQKGARILLSSAWKLAEGARITVCGNGEVSIVQSSDFNLSQSRVVPEQGGALTFTDGVVIRVESESTWMVRGCGLFTLDDQATVLLDKGARWLVGMHVNDYIGLHFDRESMVCVGHVTDTCVAGTALMPAQWSCAYGRYQLTVSRASTIEVCSGSTLALNWRMIGDIMQTSGICEKLVFTQEGSMHLNHDSNWFFGQNSKMNGMQPKTMWSEHNGGIYGDGLIGYATTGQTILPEKALCLWPDKPKHCQHMNESARNIVSALTRPH